MAAFTFSPIDYSGALGGIQNRANTIQTGLTNAFNGVQTMGNALNNWGQAKERWAQMKAQQQELARKNRLEDEDRAYQKQLQEEEAARKQKFSDNLNGIMGNFANAKNTVTNIDDRIAEMENMLNQHKARLSELQNQQATEQADDWSGDSTGPANYAPRNELPDNPDQIQDTSYGAASEGREENDSMNQYGTAYEGRADDEVPEETAAEKLWGEQDNDLDAINKQIEDTKAEIARLQGVKSDPSVNMWAKYADHPLLQMAFADAANTNSIQPILNFMGTMMAEDKDLRNWNHQLSNEANQREFQDRSLKIQEDQLAAGKNAEKLQARRNIEDVLTEGAVKKLDKNPEWKAKVALLKERFKTDFGEDYDSGLSIGDTYNGNAGVQAALEQRGANTAAANARKETILTPEEMYKKLPAKTRQEFDAAKAYYDGLTRIEKIGITMKGKFQRNGTSTVFKVTPEGEIVPEVLK